MSNTVLRTVHHLQLEVGEVDEHVAFARIVGHPAAALEVEQDLADALLGRHVQGRKRVLADQPVLLQAVQRLELLDRFDQRRIEPRRIGARGRRHAQARAQLRDPGARHVGLERRTVVDRRPAAGCRQRPIVGERRLEALVLRLRRLVPGDEGGDVLGPGRGPDHRGRIDLLRVDEQLGIDLLRLEPARSEIGGDLEQAKAEAQLELGALIGRARRQQLVDDRSVVVGGVEATLIGRAQHPGEHLGAPARAARIEPERRHLALLIERREHHQKLRIALARRARAEAQVPRQRLGGRVRLQHGSLSRSLGLAQRRHRADQQHRQHQGKARPDRSHDTSRSLLVAYTARRYQLCSSGVTTSSKRARSAARHAP